MKIKTIVVSLCLIVNTLTATSQVTNSSANTGATSGINTVAGCQSLLGWEWDSKKNRCQKTQNLQQMTSCSSKTTGSEQKSCVEDALLNLPIAKEYDIAVDAKYEPDKWGGFDSLNNFTKVPLAALHATFSGVGIAVIGFSECTAMSTKAFTIASLLGLATDIGTFIYLKYALNSLKKKLDKDINENKYSFIDIQVKTFNSLAEAYDKRAQAEKIRAVAYGIDAALYALAVIMALYEVTSGSLPCEPDTPTERKTEASLLAASKLGTGQGAGQAVKATTFYSLLPANADMSCAYALGRVIVGGIMTGLSAFLAYKTYEASTLSKERASFIRKLRSSLVETDPKFLCTDHKNPSMPSCYCYDDNGNRDYTNRGNSEICKKYWAGLDNPLEAKAADIYKINDKELPQTSCVAKDNTLDPLCACKQTKDSKGENGCLKSDGVIASIAVPGANWAKDLQTGVNNILSGTPLNTNTLIPQQFTRQAAKIHAMAKEKIDELNKQNKIEGKPIFDVSPEKTKERVESMQKALTPQMEGSLNALTGLSPKSSQLPLNENISSKGSLAQMDLTKNQYQANDKNVKKEKKDNRPLIGDDAGTTGPRVIEGLEGSGPTYHYEGDINKNPSQSIWEQLTEAYILKGHPKLFTIEEKVLNNE